MGAAAVLPIIQGELADLPQQIAIGRSLFGAVSVLFHHKMANPPAGPTGLASMPAPVVAATQTLTTIKAVEPFILALLPALGVKTDPAKLANFIDLAIQTLQAGAELAE